MQTSARQWFSVGTPRTVTNEGVRVSGFSWLCPCGSEFLAHDVDVLVAAKQLHHEKHRESIRRLTDTRER